jgi:hypothetical protein
MKQPRASREYKFVCEVCEKPSVRIAKRRTLICAECAGPGKACKRTRNKEHAQEKRTVLDLNPGNEMETSAVIKILASPCGVEKLFGGDL